MLLQILIILGLIVSVIIIAMLVKRGWLAFNNAATRPPQDDDYLAQYHDEFPLGKSAMLWRIAQRVIRRGHKTKPQKVIAYFADSYPHIYPGSYVKVKEGTRYNVSRPGSILWVCSIFLDERLCRRFAKHQNFVKPQVYARLVDTQGYLVLENIILEVWAEDLEQLSANEQADIEKAYVKDPPQYPPLPDGTVVDIGPENLVTRQEQTLAGSYTVTTRMREALYGIVDRPDTVMGSNLTVSRDPHLRTDGAWFIYNIATRTRTVQKTEELSVRRLRRGPDYPIFIPELKTAITVDRSQIQPHVFDKNLLNSVVMDGKVREKLLLFAPAKNSAQLSAWGVGKGLLHRKSNIALFMGPFGSGKTLTARALAEYLEMPFYPFDSADLAQGLEMALRLIAARAKRWGALVIWNEAEIFLEDRGPFIGGANPATSVVLQYIERFEGGMLILTTNRPAVIDEGINSRIPLKILFPPPNSERRLKIWLAHIPKEMPVTPKMDDAYLYELSEIKLDGRQISAAVNLAAEWAAEAGLDNVPRENFKKAALQVYNDAKEMSDTHADSWKEKTGRELGFETKPKPRLQ